VAPPKNKDWLRVWMKQKSNALNNVTNLSFKNDHFSYFNTKTVLILGVTDSSWLKNMEQNLKQI
jgi:hypothetical protein